METPTISINRLIATKHASETQQGQFDPLLTRPWKPTAEAVARENMVQEQSAEEGRGMVTMNTEEQWVNQKGTEDGKDIAYDTQGGLPYFDTYTQGITMELPAVEQRTDGGNMTRTVGK